jgi:hypothetical protein
MIHLTPSVLIGLNLTGHLSYGELIGAPQDPLLLT